MAGQRATTVLGSILVVIGEEGEAEVRRLEPEPAATHAAAPIVGSLDEEAEVLSRAGTTEILTRHDGSQSPTNRSQARPAGVDLGQVRDPP